jgi:hypothetical protein
MPPLLLIHAVNQITLPDTVENINNKRTSISGKYK